MQQISAASLFGHGGTPMTAVSPYGVGLGLPGSAPATAPAAPPAAAPGFLGVEGLVLEVGTTFWRSAGFGLLLLILLVAYFDIRLLNR